MAHRRQRISLEQIEQFLSRLKALPIDMAQQTPVEILELPMLAQKHGLTNYDAAYLGLAIRSGLPLATTDADLVRAATAAKLNVFTV